MLVNSKPDADIVVNLASWPIQNPFVDWNTNFFVSENFIRMARE
jgi:hypothetical protein